MFDTSTLSPLLFVSSIPTRVIIFSIILFAYSLYQGAADAATALGIINMFLISGGGLLGIGVFEKGVNIKRRCLKD